MPTTKTPLRYPGGKSKLYNYISTIIEANSLRNPLYVEPFAGGAGLALSLLIKRKVSGIIINDADYSIYAFWHCVLNNTNELIEMLESVPITVDEWHTQKKIYKNPYNYSMTEIALSTLYLNRSNRSGIIKGGIIGGFDQSGPYKINCRFNKEGLIKKILMIASYKNHIDIHNSDIFDFVPEIIDNLRDNVFIYFDPPYISQGSNLYKNYFQEDDHYNLSLLIKRINHPWILTYDNHQKVYDMYKDNNIGQLKINYSAGSTKVGNELIVFSNRIIPL